MFAGRSLHAQANLCAIGSVVDIGRLDGADDERADVVRGHAGGAVVAGRPRSVDDDPLGAREVELLADHGRRAGDHAKAGGASMV